MVRGGSSVPRFPGSTPVPSVFGGGAGERDAEVGMEGTGGEFQRSPEVIEDMLRSVREMLHMDVAFVSEFLEDRLVFRARGRRRNVRLEEGRGFSPRESYCKRVIGARIRGAVPDARDEDPTKDLWVTADADIGSYCAISMLLSDGRPYGTLCCVSHEPDPWLKERDLRLMERTARRLIAHLERGGHP